MDKLKKTDSEESQRDRLALPVLESFREGGVSEAKGKALVRQGRWAPVHYIDGKAIVLRDELVEFLRNLPTVAAHKRGGWRPYDKNGNLRPRRTVDPVLAGGGGAP